MEFLNNVCNFLIRAGLVAMVFLFLLTWFATGSLLATVAAFSFAFGIGAAIVIGVAFGIQMLLEMAN